MKLIRFLFAFLVISGLLSAKPARAEWEFHLAPYIWASSLNGSVQAGPLSADIDADFSDLVSALDIGGSLHFEAQQRPWGFFGDFMYVKLSDEENLPAGTIDGEVRSGIYEGGVLRQVTGSVEALIGVRYQDYELDLTLPDVGSFNRSQSWTDGFVGLRWTPVRSDKWWVWLRGDIGTGDSDLVWNALAGAGYRLNKTVSLALGYRYLDTDLNKNDFNWDVAMSGLLLGADFTW